MEWGVRGRVKMRQGGKGRVRKERRRRRQKNGSEELEVSREEEKRKEGRSSVDERVHLDRLITGVWSFWQGEKDGEGEEGLE